MASPNFGRTARRPSRRSSRACKLIRRRMLVMTELTGKVGFTSPATEQRFSVRRTPALNWPRQWRLPFALVDRRDGGVDRHGARPRPWRRRPSQRFSACRRRGRDRGSHGWLGRHDRARGARQQIAARLTVLLARSLRNRHSNSKTHINRAQPARRRAIKRLSPSDIAYKVRTHSFAAERTRP